MLDFVEKTLHQMTLSVKMFVIITLLFAVFAGWYHCFRLSFNNNLQKIVRIAGTVGYHPLKFIALNQIFGLGNVMTLSPGQKKAQWRPQGVYNHMNFGAESASATSQGLGRLTTVFFEAPAAHGWARTTEPSGSTFSISGSSAKC